MQVPFYIHSLEAANSASVENVLKSNFLTSGSVCKSVEKQLVEYFNVNHAKLTNSWTNGAIATLLAMGVGKGDEVIVPAMTFIATSNVVEIVGAKPVFVDVCPNTLLIDFDEVAKNITDRTKAIIPVHLYGQMIHMKRLRQIVGPHVFIIEDCAHCFEGAYGGSKPGAHSDAAIFSFYATKNITCGEGGAIITNDDDLYRKISKTTLHGMSAGASERFKKGGYIHWDMDVLGTKANLPDLLASLLPDQISNASVNLKKRLDIYNRYYNAFKNLDNIRLQQIDDKALSAHHLFPIHVQPDKRDQSIKLLNDNGVSVTVNYNAVHLSTYYADKYGYTEQDFPVATNWGAGTISLPMFPKLQHTEQEYVISIIADKLDKSLSL